MDNVPTTIRNLLKESYNSHLELLAFERSMEVLSFEHLTVTVNQNNNSVTEKIPTSGNLIAYTYSN